MSAENSKKQRLRELCSVSGPNLAVLEAGTEWVERKNIMP